MMRGLDYGYGMMGGSWVGGLALFLFGLVVLVGIVLIVVWAIRTASGHGQTGAGPASPGAAAHDEAMAVARRRFASGEITKEQFDQIMSGLGS